MKPVFFLNDFQCFFLKSLMNRCFNICPRIALIFCIVFKNYIYLNQLFFNKKFSVFFFLQFVEVSDGNSRPNVNTLRKTCITCLKRNCFNICKLRLFLLQGGISRKCVKTELVRTVMCVKTQLRCQSRCVKLTMHFQLESEAWNQYLG